MNKSKQALSTENIPGTPALLTQATAIPTSTDTIPQSPTTVPPKRLWTSWYLAFKNILPVYIATHIAFLVLTASAAYAFLLGWPSFPSIVISAFMIFSPSHMLKVAGDVSYSSLGKDSITRGQ